MNKVNMPEASLDFSSLVAETHPAGGDGKVYRPHHAAQSGCHVTSNVCPRCQGEGTLLSVGRPGEFSSFEEGFFPSETLHVCPDCAGEGVLEVCAECLQPFAVVHGREVCACAELAWLDAA